MAIEIPKIEEGMCWFLRLTQDLGKTFHLTSQCGPQHEFVSFHPEGSTQGTMTAWQRFPFGVLGFEADEHGAITEIGLDAPVLAFETAFIDAHTFRGSVELFLAKEDPPNQKFVEAFRCEIHYARFVAEKEFWRIIPVDQGEEGQNAIRSVMPKMTEGMFWLARLMQDEGDSYFIAARSEAAMFRPQKSFQGNMTEWLPLPFSVLAIKANDQGGITEIRVFASGMHLAEVWDPRQFRGSVALFAVIEEGDPTKIIESARFEIDYARILVGDEYLTIVPADRREDAVARELIAERASLLEEAAEIKMDRPDRPVLTFVKGMSLWLVVPDHGSYQLSYETDGRLVLQKQKGRRGDLCLHRTYFNEVVID